jgi:HemY protein
MLRSLFTLIKIAIIVGLVIWVVERPGTISIDWMQYKFTMQFGFFLLVIIGIVVIGIIIFSVVKTFIDMPKTMSLYRDITY